MKTTTYTGLVGKGAELLIESLEKSLEGNPDRETVERVEAHIKRLLSVL